MEELLKSGSFTRRIHGEIEGQVRVAGNSTALAFKAVCDSIALHIVDVMAFDRDRLLAR